MLHIYIYTYQSLKNLIQNHTSSNLSTKIHKGIRSQHTAARIPRIVRAAPHLSCQRRKGEQREAGKLATGAKSPSPRGVPGKKTLESPLWHSILYPHTSIGPGQAPQPFLGPSTCFWILTTLGCGAGCEASDFLGFYRRSNTDPGSTPASPKGNSSTDVTQKQRQGGQRSACLSGFAWDIAVDFQDPFKTSVCVKCCKTMGVRDDLVITVN